MKIARASKNVLILFLLFFPPFPLFLGMATCHWVGCRSQARNVPLSRRGRGEELIRPEPDKYFIGNLGDKSTRVFSHFVISSGFLVVHLLPGEDETLLWVLWVRHLLKGSPLCARRGSVKRPAPKRRVYEIRRVAVSPRARPHPS